MTICKLLAEKKIGEKTISAYEKQEKFSALRRYVICISENSLCYEEIKTAKTTWKKKYDSIVKEFER